MKSTEYYLKKAQEMGKIGTWELNIPMNNLIFTEENYKIFGIPLGTKMNLELFFNCVHPDDLDYVSKKWSAALQKEPYDIEHRLLVNNKVKWVREKADIEFDKKGNPTMVIGFTQDITERKTLEIKAFKLSSAVEQSGNTVVITDLKGAIEYVNPAFTNLSGYTAEEVFGKNPRILNSGIQNKEYYAEMWKTITAGNIWHGEFLNKTKNGELFCEDVTISPIKNRDREIINFLAVKKDITKQKENKKILKEKNKKLLKVSNELSKKNKLLLDAKNKFKNLFENSPISLWEEDISEVIVLLKKKTNEVANLKNYLDKNSEFVYECASKTKILNVNSITLDLLGIATKEELITNFSKTLSLKSFETFKEELVAIANNVKEFKSETEFIKEDGKVVSVLMSMSVLDDNSTIMVSLVDITELKEVERNLIEAKEKAEENENQFRQLFENINKGFALHEMIYDDNGKPMDYRFLIANKAFEELTTLKANDIIGKTLLQVLPNSEQIWIEKYGKVAKTGTPLKFESFAQELQRYYEVNAYSPRKNYFATIFNDVTESKNREVELVEAKEIAERYLDMSGSAFVSLDVNGNILLVNQKCLNILEYDKIEDLIGKNWFDTFIPSEINEQVKQVFDKVMKGSIEGVENFENEVITKSSKRRLMYWNNTFIKDSEGQIKHLLSSGIDITNRNEKELELLKAKEIAEKSELKIRELKKQSDLILDVAGEGIYGLDLEGNITFINPAAAKMIGWEIHEIIGKNQHQEVHHTKVDGTPYPDDICPIYSAYKDGKSQRRDNEVFWKKDGSSFPVEYISTPIRDENKIIIGAVITFNDISERKAEKQKLIIAKENAEESNKLKTEFINNMSHEIRTPMNGILGFSEMLSNGELSDEKRKNFVKIVQSCGYQLLGVIDDILEISRLGTKQVKVNESEICLNDTLLELFSVLEIKAKENKTPLYLKKGLSDKQSTILVDKLKLSKVLNNLLENALKFTNEGFVEFGYLLKNNELELYVKDTGIGIDKSKHEIIFERFSQAEKELSKKVGGLGLGLSIAKENAELLGGNIRLESNKGEGATFFVTIPYNPVYEYSKTINESADTQHEHTILIAEDEEVNYLYLETLLKDVIGLNCKILHVINGKEAVEACKENKTIDLVLMDLKMPMMNGFEATKQIKEFRPNLPIIAQTAYSTHDEKEQANLAGCDDFISKPISQETLRITLDKYLVKV